MEIIYPHYYHHFSCIAAQCPYSCCKEWSVDVDDDAAAFYRSLPGPLGDRLRQVLQDTEDGTVMTIENGRCPMWRQDGLCRIHAELGHDALCQTCREFPRLRHDYGSFVEMGLELSCPEAARLILSSESAPFQTETLDGGDPPDYDEEAMAILLQTRQEALALLSDPAYSVPHALILLYFHALHAQTLLDGGEPPAFVPEDILKLANRLSQSGDSSPILDVYKQLEILTPEWEQMLTQPQSPGAWTEAYRNLARYFVERYWLQAVSDFDLLSRAKFILVSCLVIRFVGGDLLRTAQQYSKEIENSSENLNALLDAAYESPALTDANLFGLLLSSDSP